MENSMMKNSRNECRAAPPLDFDALLLKRLHFLNMFGINAKLLDTNMLLTESRMERGSESQAPLSLVLPGSPLLASFFAKPLLVPTCDICS
jgi:hypothetical protein